MPLFVLAPDIFPQGYMVETERILWMHYYKYKNEIMKKAE